MTSTIRRCESMFDNDLLRSFVAVAEGQGFTRAAERLHLTQSAVSAQIKRLELQAGCELLVRSTRSVSLTPRGEILLGYARNILSLHDDAAARLGTARGLGGQLRIGASEAFLGPWLADLLRQFAADHPAIELSLQIGIAATLMEAMRAGHLDVVLGTVCGAVECDEVLWREPLVWAFAEAISIDRERPLPMCFFPEPCPYRAAAVSALGTACTEWRLACVSPSAAGVRVAATLGLGLTPLVRSQLGDGLREIGAELGLPALPIADFGVWTSRLGNLVPVRKLVEAARSTPSPRG
jgi:DNA-binding transcriptional LysR family regulator